MTRSGVHKSVYLFQKNRREIEGRGVKSEMSSHRWGMERAEEFGSSREVNPD